jgi:hypothetical protein
MLNVCQTKWPWLTIRLVIQFSGERCKKVFSNQKKFNLWIPCMDEIKLNRVEFFLITYL